MISKRIQDLLSATPKCRLQKRVLVNYILSFIHTILVNTFSFNSYLFCFLFCGFIVNI